MDTSAAFDVLAEFRTALYGCFRRRADALFELIDALLSTGPTPAPAHLSLAPVHRRGWGSLYAALTQGPYSPDRRARPGGMLPAGGRPAALRDGCECVAALRCRDRPGARLRLPLSWPKTTSGRAMPLPKRERCAHCGQHPLHSSSNEQALEDRALASSVAATKRC